MTSKDTHHIFSRRFQCQNCGFDKTATIYIENSQIEGFVPTDMWADPTGITQYLEELYDGSDHAKLNHIIVRIDKTTTGHGPM